MISRWGDIRLTLDEMIRYCDVQSGEQYKRAVAYKQVQAWLHELKTLKAHPNRTVIEAKWIIGDNAWASCSNCKHSYPDVYDLENFDLYCRHCGASMTDIISRSQKRKR